MNASMKLGEAIYKQGGQEGDNNSAAADASAGAAADEPSQNSGEKVMDAEYEEVKNDDKKPE
jgi:molecular chaperone DnaK